MFAKIENLIKNNPVVIFIKGTPSEPRCKFTTQFLELIK
jgi:glutaredoxin-related protein